MKLEGTAEFPYGPSAVWGALHDTNILTKTIPGCKSMTPDGIDEYRVALTLGVAAIKGEYEGRVRVTDVEFPHHYVLQGEGAGSPGYVNLSVDCHLDPNGDGTVLRWTCNAEVGGLIAGIGGRVLTGISKFMAQQFFKAFSDEMKILFDSMPPQAAKG